MIFVLWLNIGLLALVACLTAWLVFQVIRLREQAASFSDFQAPSNTTSPVARSLISAYFVWRDNAISDEDALDLVSTPEARKVWKSCAASNLRPSEIFKLSIQKAMAEKDPQKA